MQRLSLSLSMLIVRPESLYASELRSIAPLYVRCTASFEGTVISKQSVAYCGDLVLGFVLQSVKV